MEIPTVEQIFEKYEEMDLYTGESDSVHGSDAEAKRVACSIRNVEIVKNKLYEEFVKCQSANAALKKETFDQLCETLEKSCGGDWDLMVAVLLVHDCFKFKKVVKRFFPELSDSSAVDHDELLAKALKDKMDEFPCLKKLSDQKKEFVRVTLSKSWGLMQLVQAECGLSKVEKIVEFKEKHPKEFDFYLAFEFFDLSGAAGNIKSDGSLSIVESLAQSFLSLIKAFLCVEALDVYENYLLFRWEQILGAQPYFYDFAGLFKQSTGLQRLVCLSRFNTAQDAELLFNSLHAMSDRYRDVLLDSLSDLNGPLMYYSPQLLVNAIGKPWSDSLTPEKAMDQVDPDIKAEYSMEVDASPNVDKQKLAKSYWEANRVRNTKFIYTLLAKCYVAVSVEETKLNQYMLTDLVNFCKEKSGPALANDVQINDGKIVPAQKRKSDPSDEEPFLKVAVKLTTVSNSQ